MIPITDRAGVNAALSADRALLYKHSPACWSGVMARREVKRIMEAHPDLPVYVVDVIEDRDLSQEIAARTGIRHESPQVLLICCGRPAWSDAHFGVRLEAVVRELAREECRGDVPCGPPAAKEASRSA